MEEGAEEEDYERADQKEGAESSITNKLDLENAWKCNCSDGHCARKNYVWRVTDSVRVRADFESGNVSKAEPGSEGSEFDLCIWTAPDNEGTRWEARSSSWFYFVVTSFYEAGTALTIQVLFSLSLIAFITSCPSFLHFPWDLVLLQRQWLSHDFFFLGLGEESEQPKEALHARASTRFPAAQS